MKQIQLSRKHIAIFILLIIIILILLLIFWPRNQTEEKDLGYGDQLDSTIDAPSIPELYDIATYSYSAKNSGKEFKIRYSNQPAENELTITGTDFSLKGVADAKWSSDENYITISKVESITPIEKYEDDSEPNGDFFDSGNIWVVNSDGSNLMQVVEIDEPTLIDFVSNGKKIAFITNSKVGVIDMSGQNLNYVYEFDSKGFDLASESDAVVEPEIEMVDEQTFQVKIPLETLTELRFNF